MPPDRTDLAEGAVSLQLHGTTHTGHWVTTGNRIFVYWNLLEDSSLLGMFDREPEKLARVLLWDLINRELGQPLMRDDLPGERNHGQFRV